MKMLNLFGKSVVSIAVLAAFGGADAAQSSRASMMPASDSVSVARMPVMPTFTLNTIGNPAVTTVNPPIDTNTVHNITPTPTPDPKPDPKPTPKCPDGGVENSDYTITACMNDVLQCINTGALQGGLHDLFNEDVRNSIMGGMKLCQASVDKCITDVRVDCRNVYNETTDVWLDFNSRIVQPEYYNFVLRKTGLTPNQAENTCLLLDRNTYGSSFAAVSDTNKVNTEYNNKVGAYNEANGGLLSKDNPQGVAVNTVGYDGNRGHYARWDAVNAECLVRVAAYNKDKLITNSWLFGAVGDDQPAEVWEKAGSTFTCSKELFDFSSLLNDTRTAAVIAVPGGAVLGTAIGAGAGAAAYNKKQQKYEDYLEKKSDPCADESYRKQLAAKIASSGNAGLLKQYAYEKLTWNEAEEKFTGKPIFSIDYNWLDLADEASIDKCRSLRRVFEKVPVYNSWVEQCTQNNPTNSIIASAVLNHIRTAGFENFTMDVVQQGGTSVVTVGGTVCNGTEGITKEQLTEYERGCKFQPLQVEGDDVQSSGVLCNHKNKCLDVNQITYQIDKLESLRKQLTPLLDDVEPANKAAEIGKGAAIGAATGLTAGAIATGITALVERSNITCKVGDGLNSVGLGKAHTIDSLKDFYVKWNLHLPDTVSPTSAVVDKASWEQACTQFNSKLSDCPKVQINLKDKNGKYTLVPTACKVSGSVCIVNDSVMTSNGIK